MIHADSQHPSTRRTAFPANAGPLTLSAVKRLRKRQADKAKEGKRARTHWQSRHDSSAGAMDALLNGDINPI